MAKQLDKEEIVDYGEMLAVNTIQLDIMYLRFTKKEMRIVKRRINEQSDEFKDRYRWRAGVEATMSEYDIRTGVKQLRVRGLKTVKAARMMPEEVLYCA